MKTNQTVKICLLAFAFLFAFSIGAQAVINQPKPNPYGEYLQNNYGVNSIEEQAKYEKEALLNYVKTVEQWANYSLLETWKQELAIPQCGTSTYQTPALQTEIYPWWINLTNTNPFVELSVFSMSGLLFLTMLAIPKTGKKLLKKKWLIAIVIVAFVFYAGFMSGKTVAQSSSPSRNIYLDDIPVIDDYVIHHDANYANYWVTRSDGKIVYTTTGLVDAIQTAHDQLPNGGSIGVETGKYLKAWEKTLVISNDMIRLHGTEGFSQSELIGACVFQAKDGLNDDMIRITLGTWGTELFDFALHGNAAYQTAGTGIKDMSGAGSITRMRHLYVFAMKEDGIYAGGGGATLIDVMVEGCQGFGFCVTQWGIFCSLCAAGACQRSGFFVASNKCRFDTCAATVNGYKTGVYDGHGMVMFYGYLNIVSDFLAWRNKRHGLSLQGAVKNTISGQFFDNSQGANNTYDGVNLKTLGSTYCRENIFHDCHFLGDTETNKQRYGLYEEDSNQDYNMVADSIALRNLTGQIVLKGTHSVKSDCIEF